MAKFILIQVSFWIQSKLVHVGIHHQKNLVQVVIHGNFFVKYRSTEVTDLFDLFQMALPVL